MDYDFAIIGGGSAGYAAARTAAGLGLKTVVVEGGPEVGGLCILRGCMPSKTLIESANRYLTLRRAEEFGLRAEGIGFDAGKIIARKRKLIGEFADYRREQLESGKFTFIRGTAEFVDAHSLRIAKSDGTEELLTAQSFLISSGSEHFSPNVPGLAEAKCLTSDDILDGERIPSSIIVLGAGPVSLELAHYLEALGTKVTVVQRSKHFLRGVDSDVAEVVEEAFRARGMEVYTGTKLLRVDPGVVVFEKDGREVRVEAEAILNGLGRKPRVSGLNLEAAAVRLKGAFIATNNRQQTSTPHIFAAGDCCGPFEVVHVAITQGETAAQNAASLLKGEEPAREVDYRLKLYAVFTEPQVAVVGLTEEEAREKGVDFLAASYPFNDHGKSMVMGETHGFVKLIVNRDSHEIIGGAVVGPHASDLIHEVVVAMQFHATAAQFAAIPHYHPTLSEIWTYPAEDLA